MCINSGKGDHAQKAYRHSSQVDTFIYLRRLTSGAIRSELKTIAVVSRVGGGALAPAEFALTAGWGSGGQGALKMAEIQEVTAIARRLAALVLLQPRLDENYQNVAGATWLPEPKV